MCSLQDVFCSLQKVQEVTGHLAGTLHGQKTKKSERWCCRQEAATCSGEMKPITCRDRLQE